MTETRIKLNSIIENQLPQFVVDQFPLASEFLSQYYVSLENQSGVNDIFQNIDKYIKVDKLADIIEHTELDSELSFFDDAISVKYDAENKLYGTQGFPDSYGLLLIDSEIITYTSKTDTTFEGCIRGFSGITSYDPNELIFSESQSDSHANSSKVTNLSVLFLKEFFKKVKKQITPGFEDKELYSELNEKIFVKQSIDFYSSKGTDNSFKILFGALYGYPVEVIRPRDYLIQPSDAQYRITSDLIVESISGNPEEFINGTLYQYFDQTESSIIAKGTVTKVEKIIRNSKEYYNISLDSDYDKDIQPIGSIYGNFKQHPKTKLLSTTISGESTLTVDSTVGFPNSNRQLSVNLQNQTNLDISYTSKTLNQFLDCNGITQDIPELTDVIFDYYTYGYSNISNEKIVVRILGVLSNLKFPDNTKFYSSNDTIRIKTLGIDSKDYKSNNWFLNIPVKYDVSDLFISRNDDNSYVINLTQEHYLKVGDLITLLSSSNEKYDGYVISYNNEKSITVQFGSVANSLNSNRKYTIRKNISKVSIDSKYINSENYINVEKYTSNVQNVYLDSNNSLYISSPSLPAYLNESLQINDRSISFSGVFSPDNESNLNAGTTLNIGVHGLYTGDSIVYQPSLNNSLGISTGIYFIKKISDTEVKLARSRNNIFTENFIAIDATVSNCKFILSDFCFRDLTPQPLEPQKLFRKLSPPEDEGRLYKTNPGLTGIFVNGVEILNYKSKDNIYYGSIESIVTLSLGSGYDVINPPELMISDSNGSGSIGYCSVNGELERIDIIDPGFDYLEDPVITISGGNGSDASAKANLISFDHQVSFNSTSNIVKLNPENKIQFTSHHRFRDNEEIIYVTNNQTSVGGLSTNATYFVSVEDAFTIKLHKSFQDSSVGINTIQLTSYGTGNHIFKSKNKKKKVGSINIENKGKNYQNKLVSTNSSGISTSLDVITISNHGYNSGEIIVYNSTEIPVGGLASSRSYYVTKINDDEFKLSTLGIGTLGISTSFYYDTKQYVNLTSKGTGIHKFNYPEIKVKIEGKIGISTFSSQDFNAKLQPIFRGKIQSVFVEDGGSNYGSKEIINFNSQPLIRLISGSGIELKPIILNGQIVDVLIENPGSGYNSPPNIIINGSGFGALLTPIISNGSLVKVEIIYGGIGYNQNDTSIVAISSGDGAKFEAQIKSWKINLIERLIQNLQITNDDGILTTGLNNNYGLQYSHAYAPRNLRTSVQATKFESGVVKYSPDLILDQGKELSPDEQGGSESHSPIIGWSYDGNPIYGPNGFSSKSGGSVRPLKSGYELRTDILNLVESNLRPDYPNGFFIEDYVFTENGDLDEHNGRFCTTPEYPNGIYAYFTTINVGFVEDSGVFKNYKRPTFPYVIGDSYKSKPIEFNFKNNSNQDNININETNWRRNITPYNIDSYDYLFDSNKITQQISTINGATKGSIDSVMIESGGEDYKIGDSLNFNHKDGYGAKAKITSILGKNVSEISAETTTLNGVEFYPYNNQFIGFSTIVHNFLNNDLVTFTGEYDYRKSGYISISKNALTLISGISSTQSTGIITYFNVSGNLNYPIIKANDIYKINNEEIKILSIDQKSSRVKVIRNQNGTVGLTSYSAGTRLIEEPKKFTLNFGISTSYNFNINNQLYFNPSESVGLGTNFGVGIVSTIYFSNPGAGITQVAIPTKTIYIENHNLNTGDSIIYSSNGGSGISVSTDGVSNFQLIDDSEIYITKISDNLIGISTIRVGLGSTGSFVSFGSTLSGDILYFTSFGSGNNHVFKTNFSNILTGQIDKNVVTVSTTETHGLSLFDEIEVKASPGISTTIVVKYNDFNRRLIINPKTFSSINILNNSIRIENHNYKNGQKIIYNSENPSNGLVDNQIYYIVVIDKDTIKLSNSFYGATKNNPEIVNILTSQPGIISPINPPLNLTKNQTIVFDLSDPSLSFLNNSLRYSAFDFNLYRDNNFITEFNFTGLNPFFEVVKSGKIGIDSTANLTLTINDNIPDNLFYKLTPIDLAKNTIDKIEIVDDTDVVGNNKITITESRFNGSYSVVGISSTTFKYNIQEIPEKLFYDKNIEYYVNESTSAFGPINSITILSGGKNYSTLPYIMSVNTKNGNNAVLKTQSNSIGKVLSTKIEDIGFNYSIDYSVRPIAKFPTLLTLEPLSSFDTIDVISNGKNYVFSPDLVVIDSLTNKVIDDVNLTYTQGDSRVKINKNSRSISNISPRIIPTNNSNGIKIKNISFNNSTKDVTVTIGASFNSIDEYPFEIGSKVLIEGTSVGVTTNGRGYNSSNYNYSLFTLTGIDPNIGGTVGVVTYNLSSHLNGDEVPGAFNSFLSSGVIVPESYFPVFNSTLKLNDFNKGEFIYSSTSTGTIEDWDSENQYLKISTTNDFEVGNTIIAETSGSVGVIKNILEFESNYEVGSYSSSRKGWNSETGFLNNNFQRIHDSDYYQYFSYELKSKQDFNSWNNDVSSLNHTSGFKKFSNLLVESEPTNSKILTEQNQGDYTGVADLSRFIDLNCVYDFDLARENNLLIDNLTKSNRIILNSKIIQDYIESFGNRVLIIDDISNQFNSNPRQTEFSIVDSYVLGDFRTKKYFILVEDIKNTNRKQFNSSLLIHDNQNGFISQYGLSSLDYANLGFFDFSIIGNFGNILFYPVESRFDDYRLQVTSFSLNDLTVGIGTFNLGNSVTVATNTSTIASGTTGPSNIVGIASTCRSSKILVQISSNSTQYIESNEIIIINDGNQIHLSEYGQISNNLLSSSSSFGIGTYSAYLDGNEIKIDLIPYSETLVEYTVNSFIISLSNGNYSDTGSKIIGGSEIRSFSTGISSSSSPVPSIIGSYLNTSYNSSYYIISIEDKTNLNYQISELMVFTNLNEDNCYSTEFGIIQTNSSLGITTVGISSENTEIYFTPNENIDVDVKVFSLNLGLANTKDSLSLTNGSINYTIGEYVGTNNDIKKEFELTHKNYPIFERYFDGSNEDIIDVQNNLIKIPYHYYSMGEELIYSHSGDGTLESIGIATTSIPGIGITDKLPSKLYVVKLNEKEIRVSASASESLSKIPNTLNITSVGIGSSHLFTCKNQNSKAIIAIDNLIQSPIVSTSGTSFITKDITFFDNEIFISDIKIVKGGDLIKINDEIMKVISVGIGSTNAIAIKRPWFGTGISTHSSLSQVTKVIGNYNIIGNRVHFSDAPYGKVPFSNASNRFDEKDYIGIETSSTFSGRVFLRSGIPDSSHEAYSKNYIFDDISDSFDGITKTFELKSNGSNVSGISTENIIVLVNDIFQSPSGYSFAGNYDLNENSGITTLSFSGSERSVDYDVNTASIPRGGIILSVASSDGFGYQPLISAGGTAIVSSAGTIQSVSIGNSGSGYRSGIQTNINVGVYTSVGSPDIEYIGTAEAVNGHIISVAITNPGVGYTSTNPPLIVFDEPLSYSNIPLIYTEQFNSGIGTGATIDIIVGQGSSIISFELKNLGYGYKTNEILTITIGGTIGIPTNTSLNFSEFTISIDSVNSDKFSSWSVGTLQLIDSIENLFDGRRKEFPILINGNQTTIRSKSGSYIDVESTLLVFINDVLQVPGDGYIFKGGSTITFTDSPRIGDACRILFYKGTDGVDTQNVDILESIKPGDLVKLNSNDLRYTQDSRLVSEIVSSDVLETNLYSKPGIADENLLRPINWCRQTEDLVINGRQIGKDRVIYEPYIQPETNIIQNVSISSTIIFVDSVKAFFDSEKEYLHDGTSEKPQNKIIIISQDSTVSASATAIVSISGTISSVSIIDSGVGYGATPMISVSNPIGFGTTTAQNRASVNAIISDGKVSSIVVENGGFGYSQSNPPSLLIEPPTVVSETIDSVSYEGDFGIITGIKTASNVGIASTALILDFFIPKDSILRDITINSSGVSTEISGIKTGYYFIVKNSNIGNGLVSLGLDGNIIGIGSTFIDNIYQVSSVSIAQTAVPGIGITNVVKVVISVSNYNNISGIGFSDFYGEYSWGKIETPIRINPKEFISYASNGGISTSPIVQRFNRLKYLNYNT